MQTFSGFLKSCSKWLGSRPFSLVRGLSVVSRGSSSGQKSPYLLLIFPATTFCLGTWQVQRLKWKRGLISKLESRTSSPVVDLPQNILEPDVLADMEYRRVRVTGEFDHSSEILLGPRSKNEGHTSGGGLISNPKTGYQLITPFAVEGGERILINRGWIPKDATDPANRADGNVYGRVTIVGHVRRGEKRPQFVPKVPPGGRVWSYCDAEGIAQILNTRPILLEADASTTVKGGPIGGQTRVQLRNEHLQYIITWYSLTVALLVMIYMFKREPQVLIARKRQ